LWGFALVAVAVFKKEATGGVVVEVHIGGGSGGKFMADP
jgi:hypothetical protein